MVHVLPGHCRGRRGRPRLYGLQSLKEPPSGPVLSSLLSPCSALSPGGPQRWPTCHSQSLFLSGSPPLAPWSHPPPYATCAPKARMPYAGLGKTQAGSQTDRGRSRSEAQGQVISRARCPPPIPSTSHGHQRTCASTCIPSKLGRRRAVALLTLPFLVGDLQTP